MKRILIIILITIILLTGIIWEQIYINDSLNGLKNRTTNVYELITTNQTINTENIIDHVEELDEFWKDRENWLCLVINHKDMEKVGEQITKLTSLTRQNSKEDAEYEVELLKYYVEGYEHIMNLTFQNIW